MDTSKYIIQYVRRFKSPRMQTVTRLHTATTNSTVRGVTGWWIVRERERERESVYEREIEAEKER